jgi:hypothetical protein
MPACEKKQLVGCSSPCDKDSPREITFDAEFSLPCGYFKRDFLDNYDICEPQSQQMRPKTNLLHQQV